MRTEVLIRLLATDARLRINLGARFGLALVVGVGCAAGLLLARYGLRPGLGQVLMTPTAAKTAVPLLTACAALWAVLMSARPAAPLLPATRALGAVVALIAGSFVVLGIAGGAEGLRRGLGNPMMMMCISAVMLISAPILVALIGGLRSGANLGPARSGALAGLAAAAAWAALYSLACDQDDPLFVIPTYSGAVLMLALVGAFAGQFTLRL